MIDYVVVPVANSYGLANEYIYLKDSIREFLTGLFFFTNFSLMRFSHSNVQFNTVWLFNLEIYNSPKSSAWFLSSSVDAERIVSF